MPKLKMSLSDWIWLMGQVPLLMATWPLVRGRLKELAETDETIAPFFDQLEEIYRRATT